MASENLFRKSLTRVRRSWFALYGVLVLMVIAFSAPLTAKDLRIFPVKWLTFSAMTAYMLSVLVIFTAVGAIASFSVRNAENDLMESASVSDLETVIGLFNIVLALRDLPIVWKADERWFSCIARLLKSSLSGQQTLGPKTKAKIAKMLSIVPVWGAAEMPPALEVIDLGFRALALGPIDEGSRKVLAMIAKRRDRDAPVCIELKEKALALLRRSRLDA